MTKIPQMVVIDRQGFIRANSGVRGDPSLEDETSLRALLDPLLKENISAAAGTQATATSVAMP